MSRKPVRILLPLFMGILLSLGAAVCRAEIVGVLLPGRDIPYYEALHKAMVDELEARGVDAEIILQRPAPAVMAWKNSTRKLVVLDAEVIVAYGTATALAVTSEAEAVPLVYCAAYDPVGCGVGGNVTGIESTIDLSGLIANLHRISHFKKLAILYSHEEPDSFRQMETAQKLAEKSGAAVKVIETHDLDSLDLSGNDAVLLTSAANINSRGALKKIVAQARAKKIATAAILGLTCEQGVLISHYARPEEQGKGAARMVAMILAGKNTAEIKPESRPAVETAINITEAKRLGLSIPFDLLGSARVVK